LLLKLYFAFVTTNVVVHSSRTILAEKIACMFWLIFVPTILWKIAGEGQSYRLQISY